MVQGIGNLWVLCPKQRQTDQASTPLPGNQSIIDTAYLTISVDDGHPTDLRTAELLARFDLKATFYIPARNPERAVMPEDLVREIAQKFEVGAHTYNHAPLKGLAIDEMRRELADGKAWLENALGDRVISFCYPRGKFDARVVAETKRVGFLGARTCLFHLNRFPRDPFRWGLSTHAYSHSARIHFQHALLEGNYRGLRNFVTTFRMVKDWVQNFKLAVRDVEKNGGIAHLYFHSWEIEEQDQWGKLADLLGFLSRKQSLRPTTNGELFRIHDETRVLNQPSP